MLAVALSLMQASDDISRGEYEYEYEAPADHSAGAGNMVATPHTIRIYVASDGPAPPPAPTPVPEPTPDAPVAAQPIGDPIELYDWPWHEARAIRWCESQDNPNATGAAGEWGWFQIHPYWHGDKLGAGENPYDPSVNTRMAYQVYIESGRSWWQWTCRPY